MHLRIVCTLKSVANYYLRRVERFFLFLVLRDLPVLRRRLPQSMRTCSRSDKPLNGGDFLGEFAGLSIWRMVSVRAVSAGLKVFMPNSEVSGLFERMRGALAIYFILSKKIRFGTLSELVYVQNRTSLLNSMSLVHELLLRGS